MLEVATTTTPCESRVVNSLRMMSMSAMSTTCGKDVSRPTASERASKRASERASFGASDLELVKAQQCGLGRELPPDLMD